MIRNVGVTLICIKSSSKHGKTPQTCIQIILDDDRNVFLGWAVVVFHFVNRWRPGNHQVSDWQPLPARKQSDF